ncbi:ExeM/NucH family extracellular endonuclease [Nocardioides sp. LHG3406-4]|uniref:ExeM/NucH family extracellular endonuclease n=1 Tax=Nocardioides sp. LHG3406-4 TaxID=2804575 RepID=UPI003CE82C82
MSPSFSVRRPSLVRRGGIGAALLGLVAAPLALGLAGPAQAAPSAGLVISEVFGANSPTNLYNQDFVEIHNVSGQSIDLTGTSVQYRSATGTANPSSVVPLSGKVPAGGYYLVGGASSSGGTSIPAPDVTAGGMNLSGTTGTIFLADQATVLTNPAPATGSVTADERIIDLVGYGASNTFETAVRSGAPTTTTTATRTGADTDDNSKDFAGTATGTPTNCDCVAPRLKIAEVYTDGGASGATYDHDFVELLNTSGGSVDLAGLTLQYRAPAATGTAQVAVPLTGTVANNGRVIVQLGAGGPGGVPVPGVDATGDTELSAAGGTLLLAKDPAGIDPGTGDVAPDQYVADLVGWGTSNVFEGAPADTTALGATTSLQRASGGVDTDDNSADFTLETPTADAGTVVPTRTIPEIQGTGATTPLPNANVTTTGVVTASYPNADGGFFRGFYMQTPGYDPSSDATPDASDGIFVFTGSSAISATVGSKVTVMGKVTEFGGMTELTVTDPANFTQVAATPAEAVTPGTVLPGTECELPGAGCLSGDALAAAREKHEGELFQPTDPYTVTDSYDGSPFTQASPNGFAMAGEIGLAANSTLPLIAPTQVANPTADPVGLANRNRFNEAHMVTLDDGADLDYVSSSVEDVQAFPWLTPTHTVRMGAAVTFNEPVVFDFRDAMWRLQPQARIPAGDDGESQVSIEQDRPTTPEDVGGDVKIATFNVLNYFNTTGEAYVAAGEGRRCSYYTDRVGNRISNDTCEQPDPADPGGAPLPGPRGAADDVNLQRQQAKIVRAINTMDADIMGLEEIENSTKLGEADRDDALGALVVALNADWAAVHPGDPARWAFVPSPPASEQPTLAEQDAIRAAFIYNPTVVEPEGASRILVGSPAFANAREPLAQAFKAVGAPADLAFGVTVNHFKSKGGSGTGDNADTGDGAGGFNGDRTRQAAALLAFTDEFLADRGIDAMFLAGDFNAYSQEDPVHVIEDGGYQEITSDFATATDDELTYAFGGFAGSLDHVFANEAAADLVTGADVYQINANEPVYYEYSRYNANLADLYSPNQYRASDHNPEIIGLRFPAAPTATQVTGTASPFEFGRAGSVHVTVAPASATGDVEVRDGDTVLGTGTLSGGQTTVQLPAGSLPVGAHELTLVYSGDSTHAAATGSVTVTVVKQRPTISAELDAAAQAGKKGGHLVVTVDAEGFTPTGTVVVVGEDTFGVASLRDGVARVALPKLKKGDHYFAVGYLGDGRTREAATVVRVRVRG